jgi:hypothetical protein
MALDLQLEGVWFKSLMKLRIICCFPQSIHANDRIVSLLGYNHFLPEPFQFIIEQSFYSYIWSSINTDCKINQKLQHQKICAIALEMN